MLMYLRSAVRETAGTGLPAEALKGDGLGVLGL